jgi:hypothetical protein
MGITAELPLISGAAGRFDFAADLWPTRLDFASRFFLAAGNRRAIALFVRPKRRFARRTKRFALPAFWTGFWRLPFALECVAKSCADEESPALRFALPPQRHSQVEHAGRRKLGKFVELFLEINNLFLQINHFTGGKLRQLHPALGLLQLSP